MNIYSKNNDRVRCITFNAGYLHDSELVKKYLTLNEVYTVQYTEVSPFHTSVVLQEFPSVSFNSVFFENV